MSEPNPADRYGVVAVEGIRDPVTYRQTPAREVFVCVLGAAEELPLRFCTDDVNLAITRDLANKGPMNPVQPC